MDEQLRIAIEQLTDAIQTLTGQVGRGRVGDAKTGGVNRGEGRGGAETAMAQQFDKLSKSMARLDATDRIRAQGIAEQIKLGKQLAQADRKLLETNKAMREAVKDLTGATDDLTKSEKERDKATQNVSRSLGKFGKDLAFGSGQLDGAFDALSSRLGNAADAAKASGVGFASTIGTLSKLAAGLGFAIGAINQFAENARAMSGAVDLSRIGIGLLTTTRLFSSLGKGFNTVINDSAGAFQMFGATTEDAIKNLSDLSRGLRSGSKFVSGALGKEFAKDFDEAAKATARLGLTQEEQGSLQASIMQQVRMRARNEREAQQMLVKQYVETTKSARDFSNQLGVSAKEIIKSMEEFKRSTSGRAAMRLGIEGGEQIKAIVQRLMPGLSADEADRVAFEMARGRYGEAMMNVPAEMQESGRILVNAVQAAQAREGGVVKNLNDTMRDQIPALENLAASRMGLSATGTPGMFDVGVVAADLAATMREGEKKRGEEAKKAGRTEADNVQASTDLQTAMDYLRGAVNTLTATILGLGAVLGTLTLALGATILTGGGGGLVDLLKGLPGALSGMFKTGGAFFLGLGSMIKEGLASGWATVSAALKGEGAMGAVVTVLKEGFGKMTAVFAEKGVLGGLGSLLKSGFDKLLIGIAALAKGGSNILGNLAKTMGGVIGTGGAGGGIVAGAGTAAAGGATAATGMAGAAAAGGGILGAMAKYGSKLKAGSLAGAAVKGAKGFGIGAVGGIVGDLAADALGRDTKAGAAADIAGTAASYAGTGAMLGSFIPGIGTAIGAGVGGLVGLGKGLWSNASTLFGSKDKKKLDVNAQMAQAEGMVEDSVRRTEPDKGRGGATDLSQVMAYLSQISSDISAIRSNTRGEGVTAPVRLG